MRKLSTLLLPQGNKRLKAVLPALLNRLLLSNLNLPYPISFSASNYFIK